MKKRITGILAAAAIAIGGVVALAPAPAAHAEIHDGTRSTVTKHEWNQIKPGMSSRRVTQILDGPGVLWWTAEDGWDQYRIYRAGWGNQQALVVWFDAYTYGTNAFHVWDKWRSDNPYLNWNRL